MEELEWLEATIRDLKDDDREISCSYTISRKVAEKEYDTKKAKVFDMICLIEKRRDKILEKIK